jgi:protoheme ferro-lyase
VSDVTASWIGLSLGAFAAGAAIVGILALRRAFEPLIALLGAIGMAVAGWSLVAVGQAYGTPQVITFAVLFAIATGAGGYAFASALLDYLARTDGTASALDPEDITGTESRPAVFLVAPVETQEYEPKRTARELHDLADEGVLRLGIGVTPFLFAASKARYRASGGRSPAWRELERVTEAVEQKLDASLRGRVFPSSCDGTQALDRTLTNAVRSGTKRVAIVPLAVSEPPEYEACKDRISALGLPALGVTVEYAAPLWSSDEVAESVARHIIAGAINPEATGVVLVMHGQPGPRGRRYPLFEEQESAFTSRIRMLVNEAGIPPANVRTAWAEWSQPDVTSAVRHLAALGCDRVLVSPAVFPLDCIATQLEIPLMVRQARVDSVPVVMLPTWRDDEKAVAALARAANASLGESARQPG